MHTDSTLCVVRSTSKSILVWSKILISFLYVILSLTERWVNLQFNILLISILKWLCFHRNSQKRGASCRTSILKYLRRVLLNTHGIQTTSSACCDIGTWRRVVTPLVAEEEEDTVASRVRIPIFRLPARLLRILIRRVGAVVGAEGKRLCKCGRKKLIWSSE